MAKSTLPEHVITDAEHELSVQARTALDARTKVNEWTEKEKDAKNIIAVNAEALRTELFDNNEVKGKITITPDNQTAVRVEFRTDPKCQLDPDEMDNLDRLFEDARASLFEETEEVVSIDDPLALVKSLTDAGLNPLDYLKIEVKKGSHQTVIEHGDGTTTDKFICPKEGFLAKLGERVKDLSEDAKEYVKNFLLAALNPVTVLGTKTKKK